MMRPETPTQWKPGDVAMVTAYNRPEPYRAYFCGRDETWRDCEGSAALCVDRPTTLRRLVVIDPEDAEQVKRLDDLLSRFIEGPEVPDYEGTEGATRAALREFASPTPRIEEPQGLGAVVELADGRQAVRTWQPVQPWSHFDDGHPFLDRWEDITAVRVLSEGIA